MVIQPSIMCVCEAACAYAFLDALLSVFISMYSCMNESACVCLEEHERDYECLSVWISVSVSVNEKERTCECE